MRVSLRLRLVCIALCVGIGAGALPGSAQGQYAGLLGVPFPASRIAYHSMLVCGPQPSIRSTANHLTGL
jgi:hypothetical protein